MNVLFLDVDGVLNMHKSGGMYALNKKRLRLLEDIIKETGAEIVLSSTWRKDQRAFRKLTRVLTYRGLKILDVTPDFSYQPQKPLERAYRGHEIQHWLDAHPEVTNYVIVDDDGDMLDSQLLHFIQTDGQYGLTDTLAYRIKYILKNGVQSIT